MTWCFYTQVAVKFFHKTDDLAATQRTNMELVTCLRLYHGLSSFDCIDRHDEVDLCHLLRLRDVLVDEPLFEERGVGLAPSMFRATVMVFDWADGGDAHSLVRALGRGIPHAAGARLFQQVLRGLRALHRRRIAHRDIKVCVPGMYAALTLFVQSAGRVIAVLCGLLKRIISKMCVKLKFLYNPKSTPGPNEIAPPSC